MGEYSQMSALRSAAIGLAVICISFANISTADALIEHDIFAGFDPTPGFGNTGDETRDSDRVDNSSAPITTSIIASISGAGFNSSGSVGPFGNLGFDTSYFTNGEMQNQVVIESDEIVNIFGTPQRLTANFIIDGGEFLLVGGLGSTLEYKITITADGLPVWQSGAEMEITNAGGTAASVRFFGEDIGAVADATGTMVTIPIAFESADLGILGPGDSLRLRYQLDILANSMQFAELIRWEFSDPLDVSGTGDFPTVSFKPVGSTSVPEPGMAAIMGVGLLTLALTRRQRSTRH